MSQNAQLCHHISCHCHCHSSTSSLVWGLKEFTEVVESSTLPWSSLSCFETTLSIQVIALIARVSCCCAGSERGAGGGGRLGRDQERLRPAGRWQPRWLYYTTGSRACSVSLLLLMLSVFFYRLSFVAANAADWRWCWQLYAANAVGLLLPILLPFAADAVSLLQLMFLLMLSASTVDVPANAVSMYSWRSC